MKINRKIQANNENLAKYLLENKNLRLGQNLTNYFMKPITIGGEDPYYWVGKNGNEEKT